MEKRRGAMAAQGAGQAADAERGLGKGVGHLIAVVEGYPDIKADAVYRDLMDELVATEDALQ
jgi:LemA protein